MDRRKFKTTNCRCSRTAVCIESPDRHHCNFPRHSHVRISVVGGGTNCSCDMSSVPPIIIWITVIIQEISAELVIHETVVIVIGPVSKDLGWIVPHLGGQILVGISNAT